VHELTARNPCEVMCAIFKSRTWPSHGRTRHFAVFSSGHSLHNSGSSFYLPECMEASVELLLRGIEPRTQNIFINIKIRQMTEYIHNFHWVVTGMEKYRKKPSTTYHCLPFEYPITTGHLMKIYDRHTMVISPLSST